jgi:Tol biopolymer transport system component
MLIVMLLSLGVLYSEDGGDKKLIKPVYTKVYSDLNETTNPVISPNGKFIVFKKNESSIQSNLFIIPADGSKSPVRITTGNYLDEYPQWSPLGDKIAFSSARISGVGEIFTLDVSQETGLAASEIKRITLTGGFCPRWSPDAKQIFYFSNGKNIVLWEMNLIPSNGGLSKKIGSTRRSGPLNAKFSKDGKYIYYTNYEVKGSSILRISSSGGKAELVYDKKILTDISPSGNLLLMGGSLIGPANGKGKTQDIPLEKNMGIASWGNDENSLLSSSNEFISTLRIINSYGGQYRNLTDGTKRDFPPAWSPDGKTIAYLTNLNGSTALMIMPASGGAARQIPVKNRMVSGWKLSWSPNGKMLAINAVEKNGMIIIDLEAHKDYVLSTKVRPYADYKWSNDSKSIYYRDTKSFYNKNNIIYQIGLDGKETILVPSKPWQELADLHPLNQDRIFLIRKTVSKDSSFLITRSLKSKQEKEILRLKGIIWEVSISPNGKLAAFTLREDRKSSEPGIGIYLMSLDELKPVKIAHEEGFPWNIKWDKENSKIFFLEQGEGELIHIMSVTINDRQKTTLTESDPFTKWRYDISPDRSQIVYTASEYKNGSIWKLDISEIMKVYKNKVKK